MAESQIRVRTSEAGVMQYERGMTIELIEVYEDATGWNEIRWDEFHWS